MEILLKDLGKKFQNDWIFKNINLLLRKDNAYAVTGPNGSGKSTLLQVIAGLMPPTLGTVEYSYEGKFDNDHIYQLQSIAAPYLELIEEFTLNEFLVFHFNFKKFKKDFSAEEFLSSTYLQDAARKYIKNFSSGMKQRLKLGLAFYADSPVLLLDEPTSNMDLNGIEWYQQEIARNKKDRIILVCSNQPAEYEFCNETITLTDYK